MTNQSPSSSPSNGPLSHALDIAYLSIDLAQAHTLLNGVVAGIVAPAQENISIILNHVQETYGKAMKHIPLHEDISEILDNMNPELKIATTMQQKLRSVLKNPTLFPNHEKINKDFIGNPNVQQAFTNLIDIFQMPNLQSVQSGERTIGDTLQAIVQSMEEIIPAPPTSMFTPTAGNNTLHK